MIKPGVLIIFILISLALALEVPQEKAPKIVNGTDAEIADFPFMVSVRNNGGHNCGGSILNSEWILTAAHCILGLLERYTVHYATSLISGEGGQVARVSELILHEKYDSDAIVPEHDIGLVRLLDRIESPFSDFTVKLPLSGSYVKTGTPAILIGWGYNGTQGGVLMPYLQKVDLQMFTAFDCAPFHFYEVFPTNVCAGFPGGQKGQCGGDSGGPLIVDGIQVGIVSWSIKPCAVAPYPGVFTGTSHYIDWISQKTGIDFQLNFFLSARSES